MAVSVRRLWRIGSDYGLSLSRRGDAATAIGIAPPGGQEAVEPRPGLWDVAVDCQ